ncbi:MAG: translation initiation factor [Planctomycetota bacterium]|nr:translation initiation factor [Planctomycetota bacterium]
MAKKTRGQGWELISASRTGQPYKRPNSESPESQRIKIRQEKRNRGKVVTVATGFKLCESDLKALAKKLKASCGSGGTSHPGQSINDTDSIEVQGKHIEKVKELLSGMGYQT